MNVIDWKDQEPIIRLANGGSNVNVAVCFFCLQAMPSCSIGTMTESRRGMKWYSYQEWITAAEGNCITRAEAHRAWHRHRRNPNITSKLFPLDQDSCQPAHQETTPRSSRSRSRSPQSITTTTSSTTVVAAREVWKILVLVSS